MANTSFLSSAQFLFPVSRTLLKLKRWYVRPEYSMQLTDKMEERAQLRTRLQTELMDRKEKHSSSGLASEVLEEFEEGIALSPSEYLDKQLEDMGALESDALKKLRHMYTFVHTALEERIAQDALQNVSPQSTMTQQRSS